MSRETQEIKSHVSALEEVLKNKENRDRIEDILMSFTKSERSILIDKVSTIARYLGQICGNVQANVLLDIVSKTVPDVDDILKSFENSEIRNWAEKLNQKYVPIYEGVFPPFPHDWYRVFWLTYFNATFQVPFIAIKVLKRNGESIYLDQPFPAAVTLMKYQLEQMKAYQKETKAPPGLGIEEDLKELRELVDSILEEPSLESEKTST